MSQQILTSVSATVAPERESELITGFREITAAHVPDGLVRTELLRGQHGTWRIQSAWRDRQALEQVRTGGEPPAALELFHRVGAEHTHEVFTVVHVHPAS